MGESDGKPDEIDPRVDFLAGTAGGIAGLLVGHPLDTIKVRLQSSAFAGRYTSIPDAFSQISKQERMRGLWKGVTAPIAGVAAINAVVFGVYGLLMRAQLERETDTPTLGQIFVAGAGSGVVASLISAPVDLIKIKQQSNPSLLPPSTLAVLRFILSSPHPARTLFRGLPITALRDTGFGPYFVTYEYTLRQFTHSPPAPEHSHASIPAEADAEVRSAGWGPTILAGGLAGIVGWAATFPLDVLKTRIQTTDGLARSNPYRTLWGAARQAYRVDGARVFVKGLAPTLVRAVPVNVATFVVFEGVIGGLR